MISNNNLCDCGKIPLKPMILHIFSIYTSFLRNLFFAAKNIFERDIKIRCIDKYRIIHHFYNDGYIANKS